MGDPLIPTWPVFSVRAAAWRCQGVGGIQHVNWGWSTLSWQGVRQVAWPMVVGPLPLTNSLLHPKRRSHPKTTRNRFVHPVFEQPTSNGLGVGWPLPRNLSSPQDRCYGKLHTR